MKLRLLESRHPITVRLPLWHPRGEVRQIKVETIRRTERSIGLVDWRAVLVAALLVAAIHQSAEGAGYARPFESVR